MMRYQTSARVGLARSVRSNKVRGLLAFAAAAAIPSVLSGQVDQFVYYFDNTTATGGTSSLGGFDYDQANNLFWTAGNSGSAQAIRKVTFNGSTWSGTPWASATDWVDKFLRSSSVTDNGGSGTILPVNYTIVNVPGDFILNPAPVTIDGINYPARSVGIVVDQAAVRDSNAGNAVQNQYSKHVYAYDLRQLGSAAAPGSRDRNANGIVDWNDAFFPIATYQDMQNVQGANGTVNIGRKFAFSSDGQSIYYNDIQTTFGGIWKVNLTLTGTPALTKVVDARLGSVRISTEPDVVPSSLRNFGGGSGDQVLFQGASQIGNEGGLSYIVDDGTSNQTPKTLLTAKQFASFFDFTGAVGDVAGIAHDSAGNLYLSNGSNPTGVFMYDTSGRLAKIASNAEQRVFEAGKGATTFNPTQTDMKTADTVVNLSGGGTATLTQILFTDQSTPTAFRSPVGLIAYKPGDFNRDNLVNSADVALFKTKLGLRGAVVASIATATPFAQTNTANLKYDLNGSNQTGSGSLGLAGVAIDWKDVKIFQQFAGLSDGDVNMDFAVDATDLNTIGANYNGANNKLFTDGNLTSVRIDAVDKDTVNYADLVTLAANWTGAKPTLGAVGSISQADLDRSFAITANGTISQYVAAAGGAGTWSNAAAWSNGVPNAPGAVASLLTKPFNDVTIDVDGGYTIGQLNFDNYFSYALAGSGSLTFQGANGTDAETNAFAASPSIGVPLALASNTTFNVTYSNDTATLSGSVSGSGNLTKTGSGVLLLAAANSYTGNTTVNGGILQASKPGSLPGYRNSGSVTINSGGAVAVNAGGIGEWEAADVDALRTSATLATGSSVGIDTGNGPGFYYASDISGSHGVAKLGANMLTLAGNNTYAGSTTVSAGTLRATRTAALPGYNVAGKVFVASGATIAVNAGGAGEWTAADIDALRTNATLPTGSAIGIDTSNASGGVFTYGSAIGGGTIGLTKLGGNTLRLTTASTYAGPTAVLGGTLQLDYSAAAAANSLIASTSPLQLGNGGGVTFTGKASTTNAGTFAGTTLLPGSAAIAANANATANPLLMALGSLANRQVGGTADVTLPTGTQSATNGVTTSTSATNSTIGGWLTVGKTDWANKSSSNIVALATYSNDGWSATNNTTVTASSAPAAGSTTNSLRFNTAGNFTVTLSGTNTITSGGILVTPNVVANDVAISGGVLVGAAGRDLVVNQHNTGGALTIGSAIQDNGTATALTKAGAGKLVLTANNAYTGGTYVNSGTVAMNSDANFGVPAGSVVFAGNAAIQASTSFNLSAFRTLATTHGNVATFDSNGQTLRINGRLTGAGGIAKVGAGTLVVAGYDDHVGATTVSAGTLQLTTGGTLSVGSLAVGASGFVQVDAGRSAAPKVAALDIAAGGSVDLNDNDLIVNAATGKSVIEGKVRDARNGGAWDQPGLTSSAARNLATTGLGVLSGAEYNSVGGNGTFSNRSYSATDTLVKYTWNGDANFDGRVTFDDYVKIDTGFNTGLTGWLNGDFNYSGGVNFDDYVLIDIAFNQQSGTLGRAIDWISGDDRSTEGLDGSVGTVMGHFNEFGAAYGQAFLAAVPEPTSLALLGVPALAGMARRRRTAR